MSFVKQTFSPCKLGVTHWGMLPFYRELLLNWSLCNYREMAALCNPYFFFFLWCLKSNPGSYTCFACALPLSYIPVWSLLFIIFSHTKLSIILTESPLSLFNLVWYEGNFELFVFSSCQTIYLRGRGILYLVDKKILTLANKNMWGSLQHLKS